MGILEPALSTRLAPGAVPREPAYVFQGMWVADCGWWDEGCTTINKVDARQRAIPMTCANCGQQTEVLFPEDWQAIFEVLARRPIPQSRGWLAPGSRWAARNGKPEGETLEELVAESHNHRVA
jgi:hypothetical protein